MGKRSDDTLYALPETKEATAAARKELDVLLKRAHELKTAEAEFKQVKSRISEIVQAQGLAGDGALGVRKGNLCCIVRYQNGRESLRRDLLVENGVDIEILERSTVRGEGFWVCELPEIGAA